MRADRAGGRRGHGRRLAGERGQQRARVEVAARARRSAIAASWSASLASGLLSTAAARACCMAVRTEPSFSWAIARSSAGISEVSRDLKTASAAAARVAGSGANRRRPPIAASTDAADRVVRRGPGATAAASGAGAPVSASRHGAGRVLDEQRVAGADEQAAILQRVEHRARRAGRRRWRAPRPRGRCR